jgi:hypothetical protein
MLHEGTVLDERKDKTIEKSLCSTNLMQDKRRGESKLRHEHAKSDEESRIVLVRYPSVKVRKIIWTDPRH